MISLYLLWTQDTGNLVSLWVICYIPQICSRPRKEKRGGGPQFGGLLPCRGLWRNTVLLKTSKAGFLARPTHLAPQRPWPVVPPLLAAWRVGGAQIFLE